MREFITSAGGIATSVSAILALIGLLLIKPLKRRGDRLKREAEELSDFHRRVLEKLDAITDDIADLQYERLSQAHDFYTGRGWCPSSKKQQLCTMYRSYSDKGRNHLAQNYEKDILQLDECPPGE